MKTKKHTCEFTRSKPSATVDTCYCGRFRHNENNKNKPIVAIERSEHTPGPWKVILAPTQIVTEERIICTMEPFGGPNETATGIKYANARLIAAAPELRDALVDLACYVQDQIKGTALAERVQRVIAKADGK